MTGTQAEPTTSHLPTMRWALGGSGWADWHWSPGETKLKVTASYIGPEILATFMNAVQDLVSGSRSAFVTFFDEPGGTRVFFNRKDDQLFVQIVEFDHLHEPITWWQGARLLWADRVPVSVFADAFVTMIEQLLAEYGTDGYRKHWGHDFPATDWAALQMAHRA
ncbi:hypothetical protein [Streptomyces sp. NPDC058861]|uniref:hypothetical protein n=1 Tax=Streptomyces sp. NPDC058861 TaxID=3346653 RepID=UPI0036CBDED9